MISCPNCGQVLPSRAKYCARCGRAVTLTTSFSATPTLPPPSGPPPPGAWSLTGAGSSTPRAFTRRSGTEAAPIWVLIVLYAGALVPLILGLIYGIAAASPAVANQPGSGYTDAEIQSTATVLAVGLSALTVAQVAAAIGLTLRQAWGRILATVVCAVWMLSVLGIPVSILTLLALWRKPAGA